ncbi:MAG: hypothetical protein ABIQ40_14820 [Bacteroidia bacterium]
MLLGIKKAVETLSFGNKSSALSFNQKLNLLIDIAALEKKDQIKFITFMEFRNQFMHNISATSYETCFSFLHGKVKFILKHYPQPSNLTYESQLKEAFINLAIDVSKIAFGLMGKIKEKFKTEAQIQTNAMMTRAFTNETTKLEEALNKGIESKRKSVVYESLLW